MSDRSLRVTASVVAAAGVLVSGYLAWAHYRNGTVACPVGGGCETVQESEYADLVGIPVSLLGLIAYVVLLALTVWDGPTARLVAAGIALTGLVFSAYLLVVQVFVIEAFCIWCLVNDVVIAPALAVVTAIRLRV